MVTTVRIEATGDTPNDVKAQIDFSLARLGFGLGDVTDEVYERDGFGYKGRTKVMFHVPMNSRDVKLYNEETDEIVEMVNERLGARPDLDMAVVDVPPGFEITVGRGE